MKQCARCGGVLPAPADVLVIVHPSDGVTVETCSAACMAAWLEGGRRSFANDKARAHPAKEGRTRAVPVIPSQRTASRPAVAGSIPPCAGVEMGAAQASSRSGSMPSPSRSNAASIALAVRHAASRRVQTIKTMAVMTAQVRTMPSIRIPPWDTASRENAYGTGPVTGTAMTDLVARLQEVAVAAIAQEWPALEHPAGVRGQTVELLIKGDGTVYEAGALP
jgi:hypothetical protein